MQKRYLITVCIATGLLAGAGSAHATDPAGIDENREVPVFDGAFTVTVHPVDTMHETTAYADESVADDYEELANAAKRGDADAALELAYALRRCGDAATTEQALEDRLGAMLRTGRVGPPWFPEPTQVDNLAQYIDLERRKFELCAGLSGEQIDRAHDWLELAAELGNYGAQVNAMEEALDHYLLTNGISPHTAPGLQGPAHDLQKFAAGAPEDFRAAARHMLAARAGGSVQALRDLALVYAAGALSPANGYSAAANAYANLLAAAEVWHQAMNPGSYRFDEDLRRFRRGLSSDELAWAEAEARSILREENCCRLR